MKRVVLFLLTNLAVMLVLSVVTSLLGVNKFLTANGLNVGMLFVFAAVIGWFAGERLGFLGLTGGLCIVLGILITEYPRIMGKSR